MRSIIFTVLFSIILSVTFAAPLLDIPVVNVDSDLTVTKTVPVLDQDRFVSSDIINKQPVVVEGNFAVLEPLAIEKTPLVTKEGSIVEKTPIVTPVTTDVVEPIIAQDSFVKKLLVPNFEKAPLFAEKTVAKEPLFVEKKIAKEPLFVERREIVTPVTTKTATTSVVGDKFFLDNADLVRPIAYKEPVFVEKALSKEPLFVQKRDVITPVRTGVLPTVIPDNLFVENSGIVAPLKSDLIRPILRDGRFIERDGVFTNIPVTTETTTGTSTSSVVRENLFAEPFIFKEPIVQKIPVVDRTLTRSGVIPTEVIIPRTTSSDIVSTTGNRFISLGGVEPTFEIISGTTNKAAIQRPVIVDRVATTVGTTTLGTDFLTGNRFIRN